MYEPFDPKSYAPGDPLYLRINDGWQDYSAKRYIVEKVTPGGQVVVRDGTQEIRFNNRGKRIGSPDYSSHVIKEATAKELLDGARVRRAWAAVAIAASIVEKAARGRDHNGLSAAMDALTVALGKLPAKEADDGE
jgi:hypothetical protein